MQGRGGGGGAHAHLGRQGLLAAGVGQQLLPLHWHLHCPPAAKSALRRAPPLNSSNPGLRQRREGVRAARLQVRDVLEREGVEGGKEHSIPTPPHSRDSLHPRSRHRGPKVGQGGKSIQRIGMEAGGWVRRERLCTFETQLRQAVPRLLIISVHLVPPSLERPETLLVKCWCFPPSCPSPSASCSRPRPCPGLAEGKASQTLPWPMEPPPSACTVHTDAEAGPATGSQSTPVPRTPGVPGLLQLFTQNGWVQLPTNDRGGLATQCLCLSSSSFLLPDD